ncbi:MAG: hypothetical protein AB7P49_10890 [Bdellovibrionales bacterium]
MNKKYLIESRLATRSALRLGFGLSFRLSAGWASALVLVHVAVLVCFSFPAPSACAKTLAEGESRTSLPVDQKRFRDMPGLTDDKLRAESGSLSRYSLKANLTYSGPTLGNLNEKDQPNPDGTVGSYQTALGGTFGIRYRFSSASSMAVNSGIKAIHPLHGMERVDVSNPALSFSFAGRFRGIQTLNSPSVIYRTVPEFTRIGQYGYLLDTHSMVYTLGSSGISLGLDVSLAYFLYSRDYRASDKKAPNHSLDLNPNLKYRLSEKLSLVMASNLSWWNPRARPDRFTLLHRSMSQRLGVGYAWTRDIYIYPYLSFFPEHMSWKNTTLNLSTVLSVF